MLGNLITSIFAFAATNIDDIFILMLFYGNRKVKGVDIVLGQFTGIGTLVLISFIASYVGNFIDQRYVGILGLFPIYLAIKHIIDHLKNRHDTVQENELVVRSTGFIAIAGVTIANGADNIGVYVPLLTTMEYLEKIQLLMVFLVMTYIWCVLARFLASRPLIARQLDKYGHIIMPIVLFSLGLFILIESGTASLLTLLFN